MGDSMKREILELRIKLRKQESLLQSPAELLKTANQQKESTDQFIFKQLTLGVLEVWEPLHVSEPWSPSQNHFPLSSECAGDS